MLQIPTDQLKQSLIGDGILREDEFIALAEEATRLGKNTGARR